jgi:hypothetical protein
MDELLDIFRYNLDQLARMVIKFIDREYSVVTVLLTLHSPPSSD